MPSRPQTAAAGKPKKPAVDAVIVSAAIHPAIGVARVGNSPTEFIIGPETPEPPAAGTAFRDATGALKRQAARFRVYGYNAAGEVVRELTTGSADVQWSVHVANHKASWYRWDMALDIPEAATLSLPMRNASVTDRASLEIDGGARTITGTNSKGKKYAFTGSFTGVPVYLGELRTDKAGRLLFLPGYGVSASPTNSPIFDPNDDSSFINADGWYDDTCDGPVTAHVTINGAAIPVESAWVFSAPPNYAPAVMGLRTLYDLLLDLYVDAKWIAAPTQVSFTDDVYPMLQRLNLLQWVNHGFATQFGFGAPYDFSDASFIARLAWKPAPGEEDREAELRRQVLNSFRPPEPTDNNSLPWPWIYGDAMGVPPADTPRQNASVSGTQYRTLQAWAAGNFTSDYHPARKRSPDIADVSLALQPATLDRAALEFCLADAFHPGCELTWPVRHLTMYSKPFRIIPRPEGTPMPMYGPALTAAIALGPNGPLYAQGPGDLTRWMGLPWQADTAFCRSGYSKTYDPYIPTFWPARVPNQVLTRESYDIVMNTSLPLEQRLAAFAARALWTRAIDAIGPEAPERMVRMTQIFGDLGVVELHAGPADGAAFPVVMMVENAIQAPLPVARAALKVGVAAEPGDALHEQAVADLGEDTAEQVENWPLPVRHAKSRG